MTEKAMAIRQHSDVGFELPPDVVLVGAHEAARALQGVVEQKSRKVIINDEQYLEYEDWQLLAQFYGCSVRTYAAEPVIINDIKGAKAKADLIDRRTGIVVAGAEAYCLRDEANWGDKPWFQLASMAQTRAGAKACRNRLAWVAVLAGYRPTPAEEVIEGQVVSREVKSHAHWCSEHQTVWFKRGKMRNYAHPIKDANGKDTGEWCNMPEEATDEAQESLQGEDVEQEAPTEAAPRKPVGKPATKAQLVASVRRGIEQVLDIDEQDRFFDKYPGVNKVEDMNRDQLYSALTELKQVVEMRAEAELEEEPQLPD